MDMALAIAVRQIKNGTRADMLEGVQSPLGTPYDGTVGQLVPLSISTFGMAALYAYGKMRNHAMVLQKGEGGSVRVPVQTIRTTAAWADEGGTIGAGEPTIDVGINIVLTKIGVLYKASSELVEDSAFDIGSWLLNDAGRALASAEDQRFYAGGISPPQPDGFEVGGTTDTSVQNGLCVPTATQVSPTPGLPTDIDYTHLITMFYALDESMREDAIWTAGSVVAQILEQVSWSTAGTFEPILRRQGDGSLTLLGRPFVEMNATQTTSASPTVSENKLYFVNMRNAYIILEEPSIKMARTSVGGASFAGDMTHFRVTHRVMGKRVVDVTTNNSNHPAVNPYVYTTAIKGAGVPA
jgi:HK97 family phage major capsid protein